MAKTLIFVPLARNQTEFFIALARVLQGRGIASAFLTFYEPGIPWIREAGFPVENGFAPVPEPASRAELETSLREAGFEDVYYWISHEKAAYELNSSEALARKLLRFLSAAEAGLKRLVGRLGTEVIVVQELGGFLSVLATWAAARRCGLDNHFIEPSFFRGRYFLTPNTLAAPTIPRRATTVSAPVGDYLRAATESKTIVIPDKDKTHYRPAVKKIVNFRNAARLVEKLVNKHIRGQREEFSHLGGHVRRHLRMLVNSSLLRRRFQDLPPPGGRNVYFPFHVPADVAITLRAPQFLDQITLVDYIARTLPAGCRLLIKEHPALVGALDRRRLVELLKRNDNVVLLRPTLNNYDVITRSDVVVTVNSKSGAEALLLGVPVIALGDCFYRGCERVDALDRLGELRARIGAALARGRQDPRDVHPFFQDVWDASLPGELYNVQPENLERFADSLLAGLGRSQPVAEPAHV